MSLQVSGAFHTPFMAACARPLARRDRRRRISRRGDPGGLQRRCPAPRPGHEWTRLLSAQLASPVRWKHVPPDAAVLGVTDFAELGPGGVLTGMAKRSVEGARTISVATPDDLDKLVEWLGGRRRHGRATSKVSTCSPSNAWWCPCGRHLHAAGRLESRVLDRRRRRHRPRRRARGALAVRGSPAELHRRRHRTRDISATDRLAAHRADAENGRTMPQYVPAPAALSSPGGAPPCPTRSSPTTTSQPPWTRAMSGSARANRHQRASRRGHDRRTVGRVRPPSARDGRPRAVAHRRPRAGHHHARRAVPGTSAAVQNDLGLFCGAFDLNAACSGLVYGLVTPTG